MRDIPNMPDERVLDLLHRFEVEMERWHQIPNRATEYSDQGVLKCKYTYLEYHAPSDMNQRVVAYTSSFARYHVPTDMVRLIIRSKSLEKALESYKP